MGDRLGVFLPARWAFRPIRRAPGGTLRSADQNGNITMTSTHDARVARLYSTAGTEFAGLLDAEYVHRQLLQEVLREQGMSSLGYREIRQDIERSYGRTEGINAAWETLRNVMFPSANDLQRSQGASAAQVAGPTTPSTAKP